MIELSTGSGQAVQRQDAWTRQDSRQDSLGFQSFESTRWLPEFRQLGRVDTDQETHIGLLFGQTLLVPCPGGDES